MKKLLFIVAAVACVSLVGCQHPSNVQPSSGKVESHHYKDNGKFGN